MGGGRAIADHITRLIRRTGGVCFVNAAVEEILTSAPLSSPSSCSMHVTGVRLKNGAILNAPLVISAAGAHNTYTKLLPIVPHVSASAFASLRAQQPQEQQQQQQQQQQHQQKFSDIPLASCSCHQVLIPQYSKLSRACVLLL